MHDGSMIKIVAASLTLALLAACVTSLVAQTSTETEEATVDPEFSDFDAFLANFRTEHRIPALSAVILRDGEIVWEHAYGWSDDEGDFATTPETTFSIASVTKPIAAAAILAEVAAGRVALDTPMTADAGWAETCEWLSGSNILFGSGGEEADGTAVAPTNCTRQLTLRDILNMRVNGPEGGSFVYNPISYARIDRIIEGAGGRPLRDIVRDNVATPAGMEDVALGWRDPLGGAALRLIAPPFEVIDGERHRTAFSDDDFRAAAGIKASPRQLARFDLALDAGRLLPPERYSEIFEGAEPGPDGDYRWGWFVESWHGHRLVWHSGWDPGRYSAMYLKVPDRRLTLIILANTEAIWWDNSLVRAEIETSPVALRFLETFAQ